MKSIIEKLIDVKEWHPVINFKSHHSIGLKLMLPNCIAVAHF